MGPKQAWGAFSIMVVLADAVAAALLTDLGYEPILILAVAPIVLLVYFYVLYKRYHVEVVPEHDIMEFEDPDDLRILSEIYGLSSEGSERELRIRLVKFARINRDKAFVWVAPRTVQSLGTALEIPSAAGEEAVQPRRSLLGDTARSAEKISRTDKCPICDARAPRKGSECKNCGADLEFYIALGGSKIGRRVLSEKAGEVKRKLRYEVPSLREDR